MSNVSSTELSIFDRPNSGYTYHRIDVQTYLVCGKKLRYCVNWSVLPGQVFAGTSGEAIAEITDAGPTAAPHAPLSAPRWRLGWRQWVGLEGGHALLRGPIDVPALRLFDGGGNALSYRGASVA